MLSVLKEIYLSFALLEILIKFETTSQCLFLAGHILAQRDFSWMCVDSYRNFGQKLSSIL